MIKGSKIRCIDPIEGYLTFGKEYESLGVEDYAGRVMMIDDNGREGHFKPERFLMIANLGVKLTKLESTHNNLRTNDMVGQSGMIPVVGEEFLIFGEGLEFGMRMIHTTEVKSWSYDDAAKKFTFRTQNSTYELEILDKSLTEEQIFAYKKWASK